MKKREKKKLQQQTSIREHLPRLNSTSDTPVKLILILFYLLGGILVWWNQQSIAASAVNISYISPVAVYALEHIFGTYITVGGIFITISRGKHMLYVNPRVLYSGSDYKNVLILGGLSKGKP